MRFCSRCLFNWQNRPLQPNRGRLQVDAGIGARSQSGKGEVRSGSYPGGSTLAGPPDDRTGPKIELEAPRSTPDLCLTRKRAGRLPGRPFVVQPWGLTISI